MNAAATAGTFCSHPSAQPWRLGSVRWNGPNGDIRYFNRANVALQAEADIFEDAARDLAAMTDRLLRKHGKNIIGKQFATSRLANVMIDLFVLACVISRVTAEIEEKGVDAAAEEIRIAKVFAGQVRFRARHNFRRIDNNDDELIKGLAEAAYERGGYGWDVL